MELGLSRDEIALQARAREFSQSVVRPRAAAIDRDERIPLGHREGPGRGRLPRHDHAERAGRAGPLLPRRGAGDRGDGESCTVTGRIVVETNMGAISTVMAYGSEAQKKTRGRSGAGGRQAGDLHHRAGRRQRRQRHDDTRRQARQQIRHQRQEALDHRRRGFAAASDLRASVFDERGEELGHRRLPGRPRRRRKGFA